MRIVQEALTFDDVPTSASLFHGAAQGCRSLKTQLTRTISLNIPLVSAAMDTVTESRLAIALAQRAVSALSTRTCRLEKQAQEVRRVKKSTKPGSSTTPSSRMGFWTERHHPRSAGADSRSPHLGVPVVDGDLR